MEKKFEDMTKAELLEEIIFLGESIEDRLNWNNDKDARRLSLMAKKAIAIYGNDELEKIAETDERVEYAIQFIER